MFTLVTLLRCLWSAGESPQHMNRILRSASCRDKFQNIGRKEKDIGRPSFANEQPGEVLERRFKIQVAIGSVTLHVESWSISVIEAGCYSPNLSYIDVVKWYWLCHLRTSLTRTQHSTTPAELRDQGLWVDRRPGPVADALPDVPGASLLDLKGWRCSLLVLGSTNHPELPSKTYYQMSRWGQLRLF